MFVSSNTTDMKKLTKSEEEIMQIIWELEKCTVSQILDYIEKEMQLKRPPHSSISSIVRIVEEKGFLDHKAYGRTYEYFPTVSKSEYGKRTLKSFVKNYFDGSMERLVSFMVKENDLSVEDLGEMLERLNDEESKQKK